MVMLSSAAAETPVCCVVKAAARCRPREQVELLARVMRKWDEDDMPDSAAVAFGVFIVKVRNCLMAVPEVVNCGVHADDLLCNSRETGVCCMPKAAARHGTWTVRHGSRWK